MRTVEFSKKCNVGELDKELKDAGFDIFGVSYDGKKTYVHLKDVEPKPPLAVVTAHVYKEPVVVDLKKEFAAVTTDRDRIDVLAKALGWL